MKYNPEELISCFLLNSMTQEQADAFSAWVKESPENARAFIRSSLLHRDIHEYFCNVDITSGNLIEDGANDPSSSGLNPYAELWAELSREERDAPALEMSKEDEPQPLAKLQKKDKPPRIYPKGYLWFSFVSIAATILLFLFVWSHPRHIPHDIATITDVYQARLGNPDIFLQKGTRLFDSRKPLNLMTGVMKIQFDNGVQVVIEGPAVFSIEAYERMRLTYGKLYAKVPKQAVGFRVNTPSCGVIDLGTEFGVDVSDRGDTSVHLMKGKASLVTSFHQQIQQQQILYEYDAKIVTSSGSIRPITLQERDFIRDFDSARSVLWNGENLNLAYVVAGGNGLNPVSRNMGIDQSTGRLVSGNIEERNLPAAEGYMPVPQLPYVDGVFVPNGDDGPVQLSSANHTYEGFGSTDGQYFMPIGVYSSIEMYTAAERKTTLIHLNDYPEGTAVNLCLHANSGITFDLQAIRQAMPFVDITGFSSVYGLPKTREDARRIASDFYVFVDGVPRMIKKDVSDKDEPGQVKIPLSKTDRFLTLVCTEAGENFADWSLFVNPTLELESAD
jgi:hypothetical protein